MEKQRILKMLQSGSELNNSMIEELIQEHNRDFHRFEHLYDLYRGQRLAIHKRTFNDPTKINNRLSNDFFAVIVDQVVGYMYGNPITYSIDSNQYPHDTYMGYSEYLQRFISLNDLNDLDAELGKFIAIYGVAYRLCYVDHDGDYRVMNIKPSEVIALEENGEMCYALRYYSTYDAKGNEIMRVEWYDDTFVTTYEQYMNRNGVLRFKLVGSTPHLFKHVPIVKFTNNSEELGDYEKVLPLIDAYDRLVSDVQNELEEFRQAYMVFDGGAVIDRETVLNARQSGAFSLPEGAKAYFLTKTMDSTTIEKQRKTLEENIYKFSKSVNMDDEKFSGSAQSGESRKWKLIDLENKAITKERKFTTGLREMFRVLCSSFEARGVDLDYLDVYYTFNRNLPNDLSYVVGVANDLQGLVSHKTILEMLPIVDDVEHEIEQMNTESETNDIYANTFKEPQPIEDENLEAVADVME